MLKAENKIEVLLPEERLIDKIYLVRGQKVMLDKDLALLYNVKPTRLREQVKRNERRFPKNFMFRLTAKETSAMVSQNAIPSKQHLGGAFPYVFTEHGVLQLANVLKSRRAIQMSIRIIEVFIKMREMLVNNKNLLAKIESMERKLSGQDKKVQTIFQYLKQFVKEQETPMKKIGFKRQGEP